MCWRKLLMTVGGLGLLFGHVGCASSAATGPGAENVVGASPVRSDGGPVTPDSTEARPELDVAQLRSTLSGAELTDEEVRFIDAGLRRSGLEYTENGLSTFVEWELGADVTASESSYRLYVAGARVNAEWEIFIDRRTGAATQGTVATEDPAPPPD